MFTPNGDMFYSSYGVYEYRSCSSRVWRHRKAVISVKLTLLIRQRFARLYRRTTTMSVGTCC